MERQLKGLVLLLAFIVTSCKQQQQPLKGRIFERKEVDSTMLMIKYRYVVNGKENIDSVTINNRKIDNDSINLMTDPSNPGKAVPQIAR
jgi:hypothetical protein